MSVSAPKIRLSPQGTPNLLPMLKSFLSHLYSSESSRKTWPRERSTSLRSYTYSMEKKNKTNPPQQTSSKISTQCFLLAQRSPLLPRPQTQVPFYLFSPSGPISLELLSASKFPKELQRGRTWDMPQSGRQCVLWSSVATCSRCSVDTLWMSLSSFLDLCWVDMGLKH